MTYFHAILDQLREAHESEVHTLNNEIDRLQQLVGYLESGDEKGAESARNAKHSSLFSTSPGSGYHNSIVYNEGNGEMVRNSFGTSYESSEILNENERQLTVS